MGCHQSSLTVIPTGSLHGDASVSSEQSGCSTTTAHDNPMHHVLERTRKNMSVFYVAPATREETMASVMRKALQQVREAHVDTRGETHGEEDAKSTDGGVSVPSWEPATSLVSGRTSRAVSTPGSNGRNNQSYAESRSMGHHPVAAAYIHHATRTFVDPRQRVITILREFQQDVVPQGGLSGMSVDTDGCLHDLVPFFRLPRHRRRTAEAIAALQTLEDTTPSKLPSNLSEVVTNL